MLKTERFVFFGFYTNILMIANNYYYYYCYYYWFCNYL